jgi:hypothetical protein
MSFDPVTAVLNIGTKVIDRLWPDPTQRDAAKLELLKMQQTGELAQLASETELAKGQQEINKVEASSGNVFVSGWRPFIGWVCGGAFAYSFILQPFLVFILVAAGVAFDAGKLPILDWDQLGFVLLGMLGLGGMRTFEKTRGLTK